MSDILPLTHHEGMMLANIMIAMKSPVELECEYRNWRGETTTRRLRALSFWHGSTKWHPETGWLLEAFDMDKRVERDFAVADFNWTTLRINVGKSPCGNDMWRDLKGYVEFRTPAAQPDSETPKG